MSAEHEQQIVRRGVEDGKRRVAEARDDQPAVVRREGRGAEVAAH